MHLRGFSLLLAYLLNTTLGSALSLNDYYEYYQQEQLDEPVSVKLFERSARLCLQ